MRSGVGGRQLVKLLGREGLLRLGGLLLPRRGLRLVAGHSCSGGCGGVHHLLLLLLLLLSCHCRGLLLGSGSRRLLQDTGAS